MVTFVLVPGYYEEPVALGSAETGGTYDAASAKGGGRLRKVAKAKGERAGAVRRVG